MFTRKVFEAKNNRRLELISKKYSGGLSPAEQIEYDTVSREVSEYMSIKHPRDTSVLDDMEKRIQLLKLKRLGLGGMLRLIDLDVE